MNATELWITIENLGFPTPSIQTKWIYILDYINSSLGNSEWTQLPNSGLTPTEQIVWDTYWETLKNIKFVYSSPDDVVFPDPPTISDLPPTSAQLASRERRKTAIITAWSIPDWALYTQAEALTWGTDNIATPLANARTNLPATLTLATARAAFVVLLNILDKMWALQKANMQMTLALRDWTMSDLPDRQGSQFR
jgi:hypothetical protein